MPRIKRKEFSPVDRAPKQDLSNPNIAYQDKIGIKAAQALIREGSGTSDFRLSIPQSVRESEGIAPDVCIQNRGLNVRLLRGMGNRGEDVVVFDLEVAGYGVKRFIRATLRGNNDALTRLTEEGLRNVGLTPDSLRTTKAWSELEARMAEQPGYLEVRGLDRIFDLQHPDNPDLQGTMHEINMRALNRQPSAESAGQTEGD